MVCSISKRLASTSFVRACCLYNDGVVQAVMFAYLMNWWVSCTLCSARSGLVWQTGTSLAGFKPYRHFWQLPYRYVVMAVLLSPNKFFWAQNITFTHLQLGIRPGPHWGSLPHSPDLLARWGWERGRDGRGGIGKGNMKGRGIGPYLQALTLRTLVPPTANAWSHYQHLLYLNLPFLVTKLTGFNSPQQF